MIPFETELIRTLHEDHRRRLTRRADPDARFTKPKRRRRG